MGGGAGLKVKTSCAEWWGVYWGLLGGASRCQWQRRIMDDNKLKLLIYNKNALYAIYKMYFYFFFCFPVFYDVV